jgi:8-oxo-dGTP diphosphatase
VKKDLFKLESGEKVPRLTTDAWIRDRGGRLLLVRRGHPPYEGAWALPGGFCDWGETTEEACAREAKEETGLTVKVGELLGVYSRPGRDPRGQTVSLVYACRPLRGKAAGGDDAAEARWFTPRELRTVEFAFDHGDVVREHLGAGPKRARKSKAKKAKPRRSRRQ